MERQRKPTGISAGGSCAKFTKKFRRQIPEMKVISIRVQNITCQPIPNTLRNWFLNESRWKCITVKFSYFRRYFLAHILEFQFYRSLCIEAKQYDPNNSTANPLHKCDFYENKDAGNKLKDGLSLGMSESWTVALEALTGQKEISGSAMMDYFEPLYEFLKKSNEMNEVLETHNVEASKQTNKLVNAEWNFNTDIGNEEKEKALADAVLESAKFNKDYYEKHFKDLDPNDFGGEHLQRQVAKLSFLGIDALPEEKLKDVRIFIVFIEIY